MTYLKVLAREKSLNNFASKEFFESREWKHGDVVETPRGNFIVQSISKTYSAATEPKWHIRLNRNYSISEGHGLESLYETKHRILLEDIRVSFTEDERKVLEFIHGDRLNDITYASIFTSVTNLYYTTVDMCIARGLVDFEDVEPSTVALKAGTIPVWHRETRKPKLEKIIKAIKKLDTGCNR